MTRMTRRRFAFSGAITGVTATTFLAGCAEQQQMIAEQGKKLDPNSGFERIDARVDKTLGDMYAQYPGTRSVAARSTGMLVMPLITEAGIGFGGGFGRGALRVGGVSVDYYNAAKANVGIQIGANQYAHVLFFMTEDALRDFRASQGWAAGADFDASFLGAGETLSADTSTSMAPIIGIIFGQAGLRLGATIEGTKYNRINPNR